ncbi:MAG: aconitate hydratase B, partial [Campylobacteraceae bacterium]|nr:aconitate hydratase B [Campylobacteraceae bacterium]
MNNFLKEYRAIEEQRSKEGIPPLPLNAKQTAELILLLKNEDKESKFLLELLENRILPGVDEAAYIKAAYLSEIIDGECTSISKLHAIKILGTMLGGYNVAPLVKALSSEDESVARAASDELKHIILVYDAFEDIEKLSKTNKFAKDVLLSWANAEWFTSKEPLAKNIKLAVLKVNGETNTDDLSPASEAFTRSDIPLHANAMLNKKMPEALKQIKELQEKGYEVAYVGDVVGTGSSRKSGINSIQWHIGRDIPFVPNKRTGGVILGSTIAPIFFNTAEDSGALPIEVNVDGLKTGDIIEVLPYEGKLLKDGVVIA